MSHKTLCKDLKKESCQFFQDVKKTCEKKTSTIMQKIHRPTTPYHRCLTSLIALASFLSPIGYSGYQIYTNCNIDTDKWLNPQPSLSKEICNNLLVSLILTAVIFAVFLIMIFSNTNELIKAQVSATENFEEIVNQIHRRTLEDSPEETSKEESESGSPARISSNYALLNGDEFTIVSNQLLTIKTLITAGTRKSVRRFLLVLVIAIDILSSILALETKNQHQITIPITEILTFQSCKLSNTSIFNISLKQSQLCADIALDDSSIVMRIFYIIASTLFAWTLKDPFSLIIKHLNAMNGDLKRIFQHTDIPEEQRKALSDISTKIDNCMGVIQNSSLC